MQLPVAPAFPLPGPYGTQVTDAKAFILTGTAPPLAVAVAGGTWVPVGYPGDVTLFNHNNYVGVPLSGVLVLEGTNDPGKAVIHNLGALSTGQDTFRFSDVSYRWLRVTGTPTAASVLTLEPEHLLTPGTVTATGPRSAKEGDEEGDEVEDQAEYDREELESLTNAELQDILADQGKATSGSKAELVDRVLA